MTDVFDFLQTIAIRLLVLFQNRPFRIAIYEDIMHQMYQHVKCYDMTSPLKTIVTEIQTCAPANPNRDQKFAEEIRQIPDHCPFRIGKQYFTFISDSTIEQVMTGTTIHELIVSLLESMFAETTATF
jgi:hypothetical protein